MHKLPLSLQQGMAVLSLGRRLQQMAGRSLMVRSYNKFYLGTAPGGYSGNRCVFTGSNSTTWSGTANSSVNHIYRSVSFPAGETKITLKFKYKINNADPYYDYLKVWLTGSTPVAGTQLVSTQIGTRYQAANSWTDVVITIPSSYAGTTRKLVFSWNMDAYSPHASVAIDDIELLSEAHPNDECATAISLSPSSSFSGISGDFDGSSQSLAPCNGSMIGGDVWYKFTATNTKHVIAVGEDDNSTASGKNMYMQVFSGNCGSLTSISCVDNEPSTGDFPYQERFVYSGFVVGQTYYLRVWRSGTFSKTTFRIGVLTLTSADASDNCADAVQIGTGMVYHGENITATRELDVNQTGDPSCYDPEEWYSYNSSVDNTVWYKFQADADGGNISVNFTNLKFVDDFPDGIQFAIYQKSGCQSTGSWGPPLAGISDFTTNSSLTFNATANAQYYLVIDGSSGEWATWDIELTGNATLPVELLSFEAKCENNTVKLSWTTASETNNDYFTIEKSQNARDFNEVIRVKGVGNSTNQTMYETVDFNGIDGITYYRLKQTDYDGKFSYSGIEVLDCSQFVNDQQDVLIYPNPVEDWCSIQMGDGKSCIFQLFSISGVKVKEVILDSGSKQVNLSELPAGIYLTKVIIDDYVYNIKIKKMNKPLSNSTIGVFCILFFSFTSKGIYCLKSMKNI